MALTDALQAGGNIPAAGPNILGLPLDLWGLIAGISAVAFYLYFRSSVKSIPVRVLWVLRNHTARMFRARIDLQGVFLDLLSARGKVMETIKEEGMAIDVEYVDDKKNRAYLTRWKDANGVEQKKVFLNVSAGGLKHEQLYVVMEGTGKTMDLVEMGQKEKGVTDTGNAVVLHEERGAGKQLFKDFAEAMAGTFKALILPLLAGGGIGTSILLVVELLTGHLR